MASDTLPVTVAVTPEPLPEHWTVSDTIALARDLAVDQSKESFRSVLTRHKLTEGQYGTIQENPIFKAALIQQLKEWEGIKSTSERIRLRTQLGIEHALPEMVTRLTDKTEPLANVAQMAKVLADIGALSKPEQQPHATGERITISIDLGADTKLVFDKAAGTQEVVRSSIQHLSEGEGAIEPVLALPKGTGDGLAETAPISSKEESKS